MSNYPYLDINGFQPSREFLDGLWEELNRKAILWKAGIDTPSKADKLAYLVLQQITLRIHLLQEEMFE